MSTEKHAAALDIKFNDLINFVKHLTDNMYIQCLVQGNMTQDDTLKNIFESIKPLKCGVLSPDNRPYIKVNEIPIGSSYCKVKNFNRSDYNSVITNYYQSGIASIKLSVIIELLMVSINRKNYNYKKKKTNWYELIFNYFFY